MPHLSVDLDRRLNLDFQGGGITSGTGLLAYRERDVVPDLTDLAWAALSDLRRGKSTRHLQTRPVSRQLDQLRRHFASFSYQTANWSKPRRVVANVEWYPGEICRRVGFMVTNLSRSAERDWQVASAIRGITDHPGNRGTHGEIIARA